MRSKGLELDEFTCSTVISACGREGMLDEARKFLAELKFNGYKPGTVTYNSMLQVFGKAGIYTEALSILKEMEDNNCPPDSVTYNELAATYVRAGFPSYFRSFSVLSPCLVSVLSLVTHCSLT